MNDLEQLEISQSICEGCSRPQKKKQRICDRCRYRIKKFGNAHTTSRREYGTGSLHPDGYWQISRKGHPTARGNGQAWEHRVVLYDEIGPGPHPCHWCGELLTWDLRPPAAGAIEVDHLNGVKDDNRIENLAAACGPCNKSRRTKDWSPFDPGSA